VRRILRVLGTPRGHDFGFELHPEAVRFLKHETDFPGVAWRHVCPNATEDAIDLLSGNRPTNQSYGHAYTHGDSSRSSIAVNLDVGSRLGL
jgi:hypothetical protein